MYDLTKLPNLSLFHKDFTALLEQLRSITATINGLPEKGRMRQTIDLIEQLKFFDYRQYYIFSKKYSASYVGEYRAINPVFLEDYNKFVNNEEMRELMDIYDSLSKSISHLYGSNPDQQVKSKKRDALREQFLYAIRPIREMFFANINISKGEQGEQAIYDYLEKYSASTKILRNVVVRIKTPAGNSYSAENDIIMVCEAGIFVIEVKNYAKKILNVCSDGHYDVQTEGSQKIESDNVLTSQLGEHAGAVRTILDEAGILQDTGLTSMQIVHPIGVLVDDSTQVRYDNDDTASRYHIVYRSGILPIVDTFIRSGTSVSEETQQKICKLLNNGEKALKYPEYDPSYYGQEIHNVLPVYRELQKIFQLGGLVL